MKTSIFIAILLLVALTAFTPAPPELAIIVNKENPTDKLTAGEVKLYWLRKIRKRWPDLNKNIKPVDRTAKNPEQDAFYEKVLGMSAADVETYFNARQYESGEKPQDKFPSDAAVIDFVVAEAGALAFVNVRSLTEEMKSKIKIVLVVQ